MKSISSSNPLTFALKWFFWKEWQQMSVLIFLTFKKTKQNKKKTNITLIWKKTAEDFANGRSCRTAPHIRTQSVSQRESVSLIARQSNVDYISYFGAALGSNVKYQMCVCKVFNSPAASRSPHTSVTAEAERLPPRPTWGARPFIAFLSGLISDANAFS